MARKKARTRRPRLIAVRWVDSSSLGSRVWKWPEDVGGRCSTITSVGHLILENSDLIVVASHHGDDDRAFAGEITIPKVAIRRRWRVVDPSRK